MQEIHNPSIRLTALGQHRYRDYYVLHCHWQAYEALRSQMAPASFLEHLHNSHARAEAIARLYHGELVAHRHDALSLRFFDLEDTDHPLFRALCCAELLQKLDRALKTRAGIAHVQGEGQDWECAALECAAIARLHEATREGRGIHLDSSAAGHERLEAWSEHKGNRVNSLKAPYSELLERQQMQLKNLSLVDGGLRPD